MTKAPQTDPQQDPAPSAVPAPFAPAATGWLQRGGRRNVAYVVFVAILIPVANALEASGPQGPDSGGGIMLGLIVWGLVSLGFFLVNAILLIAALAKSGEALKPFIACLLPVLVIAGVLVTEDLWLA